jgi:hypothetical protein
LFWSQLRLDRTLTLTHYRMYGNMVSFLL